MANYHREVYQPSFEDGPTYDLQDEEIEDARARLPLLIVIALLVMASFGGVVWLAYNQGLERSLVSGPTVIDAPDTPVRTIPPEDGADQAFTGLRIYDDPIPPDEEAESSALAQTPQEALPLEPPPAPLETAEAPPPAPAPAPAAAAPAPAPAPSPTQAPATQAASAVSGGAVLQVGAYPSEDLAQEAWQNFRAEHSTLVAGLSPDIQRADLGERGIWYRVRIGPYTDDAAASAACENLVANGGSCFVAAP
jgi:cell division septation protein DedD